MQGLMMDMPLLISGLLQHADRHHADTEIVSKTVDGSVHRYTYRDAHARARKLAGALQRLGVQPGERIATLAWNSYRHFEIYYAVAGSGRSEEHTSELQSRLHLVCRLLLEKKKESHSPDRSPQISMRSC